MAMTTKGGMSAGAFGDFARLDQIDLRQFATPDTTPEQLFLLDSMKDALNNYLNFGWGNNGTSVDEFYWAYRYFFVVRGDEPETWKDNREIYVEATTVDGERVMVPQYLSERQIRLGCFDEHYVMARMDRLMNMDKFLTRLKESRRERLEANRCGIRRHLIHLRARDFRKLPSGANLGLNLDTTTDEAIIEVLTDPKEARLLANLVYHPLRPQRRYRYHKPRLIRTPKPRVSAEDAPSLLDLTEREQEDVRLMQDFLDKGQSYRDLMDQVHRDMAAILPGYAENIQAGL